MKFTLLIIALFTFSNTFSQPTVDTFYSHVSFDTSAQSKYESVRLQDKNLDKIKELEEERGEPLVVYAESFVDTFNF